MKPVEIDITRATPAQLRAECNRLELTLPQRPAVSSLRKKLKEYVRDYRIWQKYCRLAMLLFGKQHDLNDTLDGVVSDINNRLYRRLLNHGYVYPDSKIQDVPTSKIFNDQGNRQRFFITGRQNAQVVHAKIFRGDDQTVGSSGSYSIVFVARLAFTDVNRAYRTWESGSAGY